jgi:predicted N-acetyltransferase YhbS
MRTIRPAESDEDRLAVTAVAHAATRPQEPLEHFQARRLAHPRRAGATWWLLEEDGRPASSLVCYPLTFSVGGRAVEGYGLGAVATHPTFRRRGLAHALCEAVIRANEEQGRSVGLLFSAIRPAYYERLGFRAMPAWHWVYERLADLGSSGASAPLRPIDPRREAATLARLYERHHGSTLHLRRDAETHLRTLDLAAGHFFYGVGDPIRGYVRMAVEGQDMEIVELILPEGDRAPALRTLARIAAALDHTTLEGWFPPVPEVAAFAADRGRATTLPMVRGVDATDGGPFWSSDYF